MSFHFVRSILLFSCVIYRVTKELFRCSISVSKLCIFRELESEVRDLSQNQELILQHSQVIQPIGNSFEIHSSMLIFHSKWSCVFSTIRKTCIIHSRFNFHSSNMWTMKSGKRKKILSYKIDWLKIFFYIFSYFETTNTLIRDCLAHVYLPTV